MKKCILFLAVILLCILGTDSQKVEAYTVTVEKDGMYAEVIPDSFVNNTPVIFKKYVKKAMKYYNKYKDADDYTYVSEVPDEYREFIPVAKQIQDSDEIIIRNPFYIYYPSPGDDIDGDVASSFCFFAERNGEKLCMFRIDIEPESGEFFFSYEKIMDGHFAYDVENLGETLFYGVDDIIYAETPDNTSVVWNKSLAGPENKMLGSDGIDWDAEYEAAYKKFKRKTYSGKKDEIFAYLTNTKQKKFNNKVEKNLKLEFEDEYVESEDEKESGKIGIYIVIGIGILVIVVITSGIILLKRRKDE